MYRWQGGKLCSSCASQVAKEEAPVLREQLVPAAHAKPQALACSAWSASAMSTICLRTCSHYRCREQLRPLCAAACFAPAGCLTAACPPTYSSALQAEEWRTGNLVESGAQLRGKVMQLLAACISAWTCGQPDASLDSSCVGVPDATISPASAA